MSSVTCCIGKLSKSQCHLEHFTKLKTTDSVSSLNERDLYILNLRVLRTKNTSMEASTICIHHKKYFLDHYSNYETKCCDPYSFHKKIITTQLRVLSYENCKEFNNISDITLIPGKKICSNCLKLVMNIINEAKTPESQTTSEGGLSSQAESTGSVFTTGSQSQKRLSDVLEILDMPPLKLQKLSEERKLTVGARLVSEIHEKIIQQVQNTYGVDLLVNRQKTEDVIEIKNDFVQLMKNLQSEFQTARTLKDKIDVLKLLPKSWSFTKINLYFPCTYYMFEHLQKFRETGIIRKTKRLLYDECIRKSILDFYKDMRNAHICPGTKQCLTITDTDTGTKKKQQKILLQYDIKDLYQRWKKENSDIARLPSLSFFKMLRPKECLPAGSPGTHNICVCLQHENVKLMIYALKSDYHYRDLFEQVVCDVDHEDCMLHKCSKCPGEVKLREFIRSNMLSNDNTEIVYNTWDKSYENKVPGAMSLLTVTEKTSIFIDKLAHDTYELTKHHFLSEAQKKYLQECKKCLTDDTCVVLMDFAENYSFIIQNSVQAFYYNNSQATVHPFVMYHRNRESKEIDVTSYCVISDSLQHTAATVFAFQNEFTTALKHDFPSIKKIIYFSDGAPTQYKNKNHFANINLHESTFGLKLLSHNFFATSHGKSPCDGIGAVVKRSMTIAAIQRPPDQQIRNAQEMYAAALEEISGVRILWVDSTEVQQTTRKMQKIYDSIATVHGTRDYHCCSVQEDGLLFKDHSAKSEGTLVQFS